MTAPPVAVAPGWLIVRTKAALSVFGRFIRIPLLITF